MDGGRPSGRGPLRRCPFHLRRPAITDLSKRETPLRAIPQRTFRRETTLPSAPTDRPEREVNANIRRPAAPSNAEALANILQVASEVASNIGADIQTKEDKDAAAQAAFDFASGDQNAELFKKSRAYFRAWQLEGAKAKSLDIAQRAADKVQEALNSPNATVEDADAAIESVFHRETHDERGNLLDFGTPEAKLTLGHALAEVKARLIPAAHDLITNRQNTALMATTLGNMVVERVRGAPIGSPEAAQIALTDPLAPLPEPAPRAPTHALGRRQLVVETGAEPELKTAPAAPAPASPHSGLNAEEFLSRLPPSISREAAKEWFVRNVIAEADLNHDPSLLDGLAASQDRDGLPTFNPAQQYHLMDSQDDIRARVEKRQNDARDRLQSENLDAILNAYNNGHPLSDSWLAAQGAQGLIEPRQAYTLIQHNRAMRHEAEAEARAENRAEHAEAEATVTNDVNSLASAMLVGVPSALATTDEDLRKQFQAGEFGPVGSRSAMAHYRTLLTSRRQGIQKVEQSPEFARYGALLEQWKPLSIKADGNPLLGQLNQNRHRLDKPSYVEMTSYYRELVEQGKSPGDAYRTVVDKYAPRPTATPPNSASAVNRLSYLRCKRAGLCR